ncbi:hypothetical protein L1049_008232 [Liquidambar formosana]|uniref:Uncharacterized protein n=1 Tax=Liquidambar formosana TaxID=63359 RepID=A0AAP0S656_LIQFO
MFDTMPSAIRSSNEYLEPLVDMGYSLELKRNSRQQQTSKIVKERFPSPQARRTIKFQDKLIVENLIGQPYGVRHHGPRENVDDGLLIQPKYSENRQKQSVRRKAMKDDELVRHMSNLPGYLQRVDRGENVQEKALNVGVLNWEHLEKWKYSQKHIPARGSTNASSTSSNSSLFMPIGSSTISSTVQNETLAHQSKQKSLLRSNVNSSRKSGLSQGGKAPQGKVRCLQDFEVAPKGSLDWQKKIHRTDRSSGRNYPEIMHAKGKRKDLVQKISSEMGTSSANLKNYGVSLSSKEKMSAHDGDTKKGIEELQESEINGKNFDQQITSEMGSSSSNLRNNGVSLRSKEKLCVWDGATEKRVEKLQESDINLAHQLFPGEHEDIVLLFPRNLPQNSFSDSFHLSEPRTSLGENLSEANRKSFSYGFSPKVHSAEFYSEIPHSCPLPCGVETDTESDIRPH